MRTTINLPADSMALARKYAQDEELSLGEAIGELIRKGVSEEPEHSEFWKGVKFLPHRPGQPKVTLEDVNRIRDSEW